MNELNDRLERLGLSEYLDVFLGEGYDTWDILCDITESDLHYLNVKLGHRRKLQRAIRDSRGLGGQPESSIVDGAYRSEDSAAEGKFSAPGDPAAGGSGITKRKYRRHPKADENAPERAPSAYVIFSNHIRETLRGQELSFTEIAKVVGERWQLLPQQEREGFERQAAAEKERYYAQLAEYKKTPEYAQYQEYLADFKAKHSVPRRDGKRTKVEAHELGSTRSSSHEHGEKRRVSIAAPETHVYGGPGSSSGPPSPAFPVPGTQAIAAPSASPGIHTFPSVNSPQIGNRYASMSASPVSNLMNRDSRDSGGASSAELRERERPLEHRQPSRNPSAPQTPVSHLYGPPTTHSYSASPYQSHVTLSSRRILKEHIDLPPPLVHEETASTEASTPSNIPYQSSALIPSMDAAKAHRILPHPVPSAALASLPLDPRHGLDMRQATGSSGWPALLRASELFRDADNNSGSVPSSDKDTPPTGGS